MNNDDQIIKNKNSKRGIILAFIIGSIMLVGFLGSYAYFIGISNNTSKQETTVNTGNVVLVFEDGSSSFQGSLEFGESATKSFTLENTGTLDATVTLNWDNLINTYLENSMTYSLLYAEEENGEYTEIVTNENVPRSEEPVLLPIAKNILIQTAKKYYYKLVITFNYLEEVDQTPDLNAILSTNFVVKESPSHKVTFASYNGSIGESIVFENSNYGKMPEPYREGYVFIGWFTNQSGGERITEDTEVTITKDHTLYARWETLNDYNAKQTVAKLNIKPKSGSPNYSSSAFNDQGVYTMKDNYGTSYYYRGAVTNNYVKFAGFYWRIIRVNGDGSLRIIYDGTRAHTNGESNSDRVALYNQVWSRYHDDNKYMFYMYGSSANTGSTSKQQAQTNSTDTDIKTSLENWYNLNILNKNYDSYVADSIFCNDRTTNTVANKWHNADTTLGYSYFATAYAPLHRMGFMDDKAKPTLICSNKNDAFTKDDIVNGNGALNQKVGLLTADDAMVAGSGFFNQVNTSYYLFKGPAYWVMSPTNYYEGANVTAIYVEGELLDLPTHSTSGLAPVINLTPEYVYKMIGDGTIGNEYRVE